MSVTPRGRALGMAVLALAGLVGCRSGKPKPCQQDSECAANEVCFVDGCGDPGQGLAAEVAPSASSNASTQDFLLSELAGIEDLTLSANTSIHGELKRAPSGSASPAPYTSRVSFRVNGRSAIIPDISRHFETFLATPQGNYTVPLSAGIYTVTVQPDDLSVPPFVQQNVDVEPDSALDLDVQLVPAALLLKSQGVLLGSTAPITSAVYEIQALAIGSLLPVSQRSPVSASGDFALFVSPTVHDAHSFVLQASPRDATAVAPKKTFVVSDSALPQTLTLGDFGAAVPLSGALLGSDGMPVPDATVYVDGTTAGGGSFSSVRAHTDAQGSFQISTLPPQTGSSLSVVAVPPAGVQAGTVRVPLTDTQDPLTLSCPARPLIEGRLLRPEGTPALNVPVSAEAVAGPTEDALLPPGGDTTTDIQGHYALYLEPGKYRLDFQSQDLPRLSRFVTVVGSPAPQQPDLSLSLGKRVTGTIQISGDAGPTPANLALVRIFRISSDPDSPTSVLLGEAYTDTSGRYSILLPTR